MWTKIIATFRNNRMLKSLVRDLGTILEDSESMYGRVLEILHEGRKIDYAHDFIYETDKRINRAEQEIRRKLIQHLSLTGVMDLPAALILMSVMKDAERLGDYCKNMYEVCRSLDMREPEEEYWSKIRELQLRVRPMFQQVKRAFIDSDKETANAQMEEMQAIAKESDALLEDLYGTTLPAGKAIGYALLTRYCKRVASHLGNIASSVVVPLPMLDFLDEPDED